MEWSSTRKPFSYKLHLVFGGILYSTFQTFFPSRWKSCSFCFLTVMEMHGTKNISGWSVGIVVFPLHNKPCSSSNFSFVFALLQFFSIVLLYSFFVCVRLCVCLFLAYCIGKDWVLVSGPVRLVGCCCVVGWIFFKLEQIQRPHLSCR